MQLSLLSGGQGRWTQGNYVRIPRALHPAIRINSGAPQKARTAQNEPDQASPKALLEIDIPATAENSHRPPKNFTCGYWRVVTGQRVSPRKEMILCNALDSMQCQLFLVAVQNNLSRPQIGEVAVTNYNQIAGPDCWQHAGTRHFKARLAFCTNCF